MGLESTTKEGGERMYLGMSFRSGKMTRVNDIPELEVNIEHNNGGSVEIYIIEKFLK